MEQLLKLRDQLVAHLTAIDTTIRLLGKIPDAGPATAPTPPVAADVNPRKTRRAAKAARDVNPRKPKRRAAGNGLTLRSATEAIVSRWSGNWTSKQVREQLAQRHPGIGLSNLSTVLGRMLKDGQIVAGPDGKSWRTQKSVASAQATLDQIKAEITPKPDEP